MLKRSITFEDYDGETVTQDFYFNLSKAEMIELELSEVGGLSKKLEEIVKSNDGSLIIQTFKDLVLKAYGIRSDDGRRFIKTQEIRDEFQSTEAYSALFMELVTDAEKAAEFVNGVVPKGLDQDMERIARERDRNVFKDHETRPVTTPPPGTPRVLSRAELESMDSNELSHLLSTGQAVIGESE